MFPFPSISPFKDSLTLPPPILRWTQFNPCISLFTKRHRYKHLSSLRYYAVLLWENTLPSSRICSIKIFGETPLLAGKTCISLTARNFSQINKSKISGVSIIKLKLKCTFVQAARLCTGRTAHRGSRGTALLFLYHVTRRECTVVQALRLCIGRAAHRGSRGIALLFLYHVTRRECTVVQALRLCTGRTAHRGSRGIALLFLYHVTRRECTVLQALRLCTCHTAHRGSRGIALLFLYHVNRRECTVVQALRLCTGHTAHRGGRGIALLFLDHGTRRGEGSASRPGHSLPWERPSNMLQEVGWTPGPVWTGAENLAPNGIRSLDRPVCSQSLYWLSYRAHFVLGEKYTVRNIWTCSLWTLLV